MSSSTTRLLHRFIHSSSHRPPLQGVQTRSLSSSLHAPSCSRSAVLPLLTQLRSAQRPFSTSPVTRAYRAPKVEGEPTVLSAKPSPETEDDIDLVPDEQAKLLLTRRAAEQLKTIADKQHNPDVGLRIRVDSGGCHGYQYAIELAKGKQADDYVFSHTELKPANVYIDAVSLTLMKGSLIDYATELIGSSFRVNENPQAKGAGCGCGVSWELKDDVVL
ncbi:[4Fe-4S] proteins maturation [Steccherinum ochraceum]|uniref:[4Fe-4S] proteins maturation n=1 Tax=Steccherinum ochraceum TaxID=92696 RepID=A0A4R0REL7_9APHY|nr:[4Fe-4S] proteins maturation [Steccherinum ochraceum]